MADPPAAAGREAGPAAGSEMDTPAAAVAAAYLRAGTAAAGAGMDTGTVVAPRRPSASAATDTCFHNSSAELRAAPEPVGLQAQQN